MSLTEAQSYLKSWMNLKCVHVIPIHNILNGIIKKNINSEDLLSFFVLSHILKNEGEP